MNAQQDGEVVRISGVIRNRDNFGECANFMRPTMSRIQSIARTNFAGSLIPHLPWLLPHKSDHRPLFPLECAPTALSLQCNRILRTCQNVNGNQSPCDLTLPKMATTCWVDYAP